MKKLLLLLLVLVSLQTQAQIITSENYYEYFQKFLPGNKLTTAWLTNMKLPKS